MKPTADAQWHWQSDAALALPGLKHWLQDTGSLTVRLRHCCQDFKVQLLNTRAKVPLSLSQATWLGESEGYCREVLLLCDNVPWVYASSVYSPASLDAVPALGGLGDKALGELMFENPKLSRSCFEFAALSATSYHVLSQHLAPWLVHLPSSPAAPVSEILPWARRSVLAIPEAKVLVTELFLPAANAYQE